MERFVCICMFEIKIIILLFANVRCRSLDQIAMIVCSGSGAHYGKCQAENDETGDNCLYCHNLGLPGHWVCGGQRQLSREGD